MSSTVKLVVVGDSAVGKTSIIQQFVNRRFTADFKSTIGTDFASKPVAVDDAIVNMQIWDTAGQERYRSLATSYFKGCEAAVVVFDLTNEDSFQHLNFWIEEVQRSCQLTAKDMESQTRGGGFPLIVVGNKSDLEDGRAVPKKAAYDFCKIRGWHYFEVSAKFGDNVDTMFKACAVAVVDRRKAMPAIARPGSIQRPAKTLAEKPAAESQAEGGGFFTKVKRRCWF